MEAHLTGLGFQVTAVTPELQAISQSEVTSWKWDVQATEPGHHRLHLTVTAIFDIGGSPTPRTIRTFDRTIEVKVTFSRRVVDFGRANWEWLWAALVVPLGGWFIKRRLRARKVRTV